MYLNRLLLAHIYHSHVVLFHNQVSQYLAAHFPQDLFQSPVRDLSTVENDTDFTA